MATKPTITKPQYETLITHFLRNLSLQPTPYTPNPIIAQSTLTHCQTLVAHQPLNTPKTHKIATLASDASCRCYPFHAPALQNKTALFFAYFFTINNNLVHNFPHEAQNLPSQHPPPPNQTPNPTLQILQTPPPPQFQHLLRSLPRRHDLQILPSFLPSFLEFISATVFESNTNKKLDIHTTTATHFPDSFRLKTGLPEGFIYLLAPREGLCGRE
ncbi:hypothetical protein BO78DRAFT_438004 [Aspergillus sclerotiicarbonarius CBS 121057]|uniref:Uncharacterized protein n=1 Tax=Aspergillus sclerotiicarbonarius (strain CBS 121057 / IBT 28362) TaxID=1448318 RepID=A0A319EIX1_ASPSB|nr:hypothetical protein BO78DRAFT_438004 [Aspergillus sclerotiicarbonarius CBS 121057]